jgi:hypothetical protein
MVPDHLGRSFVLDNTSFGYGGERASYCSRAPGCQRNHPGGDDAEALRAHRGPQGCFSTAPPGMSVTLHRARVASLSVGQSHTSPDVDCRSARPIRAHVAQLRECRRMIAGERPWQPEIPRPEQRPEREGGPPARAGRQRPSFEGRWRPPSSIRVGDGTDDAGGLTWHPRASGSRIQRRTGGRSVLRAAEAGGTRQRPAAADFTRRSRVIVTGS